MLVGIPKEIKDNEYRVGVVPSTVRELTAKGHGVLVETRAGLGAGLSDAEYEAAGAKIVASPAEIFAHAELIVKVKEPLPPSVACRGAARFCLPAAYRCDLQQARDLLETGVTAIAYETDRAEWRYRCSADSEVPAAWRRTSARTASKKRMAGAACCSKASGVGSERRNPGGGVAGTNARSSRPASAPRWLSSWRASPYRRAIRQPAYAAPTATWVGPQAGAPFVIGTAGAG
jgi:alanine dehydrogenase